MYSRKRGEERDGVSRVGGISHCSKQKFTFINFIMHAPCILHISHDWDISKRKYMYREINTFSLCGHVEPILRLNPSPEDYEFHILGKGLHTHQNCSFSLYISHICGSGKEEFLNLIHFHYMDIISH